MKKCIILYILALLLSLFSCKEDPQAVAVKELKEYDLRGNAQKGPFINGSSITIFDLDSDFKPTGRTFQVNTDATGHFELPVVKLNSDYVQIVADGFYYNEVSGNLSNERMMLKAFVNLAGKSVININVLTNLEYERIRYLMANQTLSYSLAKNQAQNEILKVFNMEDLQVGDAESLDIAKLGVGDGVLLAVSAILQGSRSTAELSKLQADMISDLKEDGILNDTVIQSSLISHSRELNLSSIKDNVINKYKDLGIQLNEINNFDEHIKNFNLKSSFHFRPIFEFPLKTVTGINFLNMDFNKIKSDTLYAFAVKMPKVGKMQIKMKLLDGYKNFPLGYEAANNYGWKISTYDAAKGEQTFTSILNDVTINMPIIFPGFTFGKAVIEYYYNDSATPAKSRTVTWGGYVDGGYIFQGTWRGPNLLAFDYDSTIKSDTTLVIGVIHDEVINVNFKILHPSTVTIEPMDWLGTCTYKDSLDVMEIKLKTDYESTAGKQGSLALKFKGTGTIAIESDLKLSDGTFLKNKLNLTN